MPHSLKTVFLSFVALVFMLLTLFWFSPLRVEGSQRQAHIATPSTPVTRPTVTKRGNVIFFMGLVVTALNIPAGVMDILMRKNFPIWVGARIQKALHIGE